jgi:hypothetical protein
MSEVKARQQLVVGFKYQLEAKGVDFMKSIIHAKFKNADGSFMCTDVREGRGFTDDVLIAGKPAFFPEGTLHGEYKHHQVTLIEEA